MQKPRKRYDINIPVEGRRKNMAGENHLRKKHEVKLTKHNLNLDLLKKPRKKLRQFLEGSKTVSFRKSPEKQNIILSNTKSLGAGQESC